ncbi:hypothetical protein [Tenacibaculum sp. nBUS_03]|uniref:hypothetical protein n=1 Tax=Tenacibaculum sp. nBUS_03 TaxID=3395320 RepID=UPI003EBDDA65
MNNGELRVGNGNENSINALGNMQQPFYFNSTNNAWRKLTYATYPLDIRWGVGGDGSSNWNTNGQLAKNPTVSNVSYDYTNLTITNPGTGDGYGTVIFSGNITINSQLFLVENTYSLDQGAGYIRIKVKITNVSGNGASNIRLWFGTRDDWVGTTDRTNER